MKAPRSRSVLEWLLAALLSGPAVPVLYAQNASVRGFVTDADQGQPLPGVNVVLTGPGGAFYGSATDTDGLFSISRVPLGRYALSATYIGFETFTDTLALAAAQILTYNIVLQTDQAQLDEVLVEAERETAGGAAVTAGLQTIRPTDIELVPAPECRATSSPTSSRCRAPSPPATGAGSSSSAAARPRRTWCCSTACSSTSRSTSSASTRPSRPTSSTAPTSTRAASGALRGAALLGHRRFDAQRQQAPLRRGGVGGTVRECSTLGVSAARLEGPLLRDRVSVLFSARKSVIEQGASRLIDQALPFEFDDQFGKLHAVLSENSQASVSAIRTFDRGILGEAALGRMCQAE